jgi:hypothetical protein
VVLKAGRSREVWRVDVDVGRTGDWVWARNRELAGVFRGSGVPGERSLRNLMLDAASPVG